MPPAYEFRGSRRQDDRGRPSRSHQRHEFTFRYARPATAERPLLRTQRNATPELLVGESTSDAKPALKFAPLDDLSDSDEADMDVSTDEDGGADQPPRKKRALEDEKPGEPPVSKWSNPDPYTVLPPPDETQTAKKIDVVKLIRKARVAANAGRPAAVDAVAANEDFISFGADFDDDTENNAPENAPKGPKRDYMGGDSALSGRKRTHDDEIKGYSKKTGKPLAKYQIDGSIISEWRALSRESGCPWMHMMEPTLHIGTRLHNEILSFYHWVKPQPFEQIVRQDLISRLQSAFQSRYHGVQLRPFGSFASGLYLPVADIDLVLLSRSFMSRGIKTFGERKGQIYAFAAFVKNLEIAVPGSIETIAHARVPILKFVDKLTGLRVDLSFDNDSGVIANGTFETWKLDFPGMPVIVSVIKQFLLLRGLNEVPTGGLGGFSITCLVTSLLQHLPHGRVDPNLGSILMDFLDFYGNRFDYETVGIRLKPPGYFNKRVYKAFRDNNDERLSIEDPNNPENDISGGTREISLIFKCFSEAYEAVKERMISTAVSENNTSSLLGTIIAANYQEYLDQRQRLRDVFERDPRFAQYHEPPSPPPPPTPEYVPPPPSPPPPPAATTSAPSTRPSTASGTGASSDQKEKLTKLQRRMQAARDRADKLKQLRPDIALIPDSISNEQAPTLGGYEDQSHMDRDLAARKRQQWKE